MTMNFKVTMADGFQFHTPNPGLLQAQEGLEQSGSNFFSDMSSVARVDAVETNEWWSANGDMGGSSAVQTDPGSSLPETSGQELLPEGDPEQAAITNDPIGFPIGGALKALGALGVADALISGFGPAVDNVWNAVGGVFGAAEAVGGGVATGANLFQNGTQMFGPQQASPIDHGAAMGTAMRGGQGTMFGGQQFAGRNQSRFNNFYRSMAS